MRVDPVILFLENRGFLGIGLITVAWVVAGANAAPAVGVALASNEFIAKGAAFGVACITGGGCLVAFWAAMGLLNDRLRGYGLRPLRGSDWVYREHTSEGEWRTLSFSQRITGPGYPAPREVTIPSDASWNDRVPSWAHGRRIEITERIVECFGGNVEFVDAPSSHAA